MEEIAGEEAKDIAAASIKVKEESKTKQLDASGKGDKIPNSSTKVFTKDDKKVNTLAELKKQKEESKTTNSEVQA